MGRIVKLKESDVLRLVEKVIYKESCGGGESEQMGGFADLGGPGMGFQSPMESPMASRYGDYLEDEGEGEDYAIVNIDISEQDETETDDEDSDDEESTDTVVSGSGKFSETDVTAIKLYNDGKKKMDELTVNQKLLLKLLS